MKSPDKTNLIRIMLSKHQASTVKRKGGQEVQKCIELSKLFGHNPGKTFSFYAK